MTRSVEIPDEVVAVARDAYQRAYPGGIVGARLIQIRAALEAALPFLAPAEPEDTRTDEERGFVEIALAAADSGSAGDWPTVAGYLADEVRRLRAASAAVPQPVDREALVQVLAAHNIECTGPGEVTCRGCREKSWMSWSAYRAHVADAVLAVLAEPEAASDSEPR